MEVNQRTFDNKGINKLLIIAGILIFAYTVIRASVLSITYDEAFCYCYYVRNKLFFSATASPVNIQLLNNFLMIVSTKLFGTTEFFLRLPNLLAHLLFLIYSAKLLKHLNNKWIILSAFLIVNLNPYLLDFFSLGRQYGLSTGLMMASIYYLYKYIEDNKIKYSSLSMLFASLSTLSSIVMLNFCMILFGVILISETIVYRNTEIKSRKHYLKAMLFPLITLVLLIIVVVPFAMQMKETQQLFFGGNQGFIEDTVRTAVYGTFYSQAYGVGWVYFIAKLIILIILVGSALWIMRNVLKDKKAYRFSFSVALLLLIIGCACSTVLQFHLMGTLYLVYRTTLFYVVLFNLLFIFLIVDLSKKYKNSVIILFIATLLATAHFFNSFNFRKSLEWADNSNIKEMMSDLEKVKTISSGGVSNSISIFVSPIFQPGVDFYRDIKNLKWLNKAIVNEPFDARINYFYLTASYFDKINKDSLIVIKKYDQSKSVLAKRRYDPKHVILLSDKKEDLETYVEKNAVGNHVFSGKKALMLNEENRFSKSMMLIIDSIPHPYSFINFAAMVLAPDIDKENEELVVSIKRGEAVIYYKPAFVKDFLKADNQWTFVSFCCNLPPQIKPGDVLNAYIWSPSGKELYVDDIQLKWIEEKFN